MAFLYSIWCEYGKCRSCMIQKEHEARCALPLSTFAKDTQITATPWRMRECLPPSWRLARALLSKQQRASWCGLSFPLSWPGCSVGVRGVWEKPVWKRKEEVCIYLCWWGMIPTLICLQTSSWTALWAAEAISSMCQPQWCLDSTCQDKGKKASAITAGAVKIMQLRLVDLYYIEAWLTAPPRTYAHVILYDPVSWQLPFSSKSSIIYYWSLTSNQRI